MGQVNGRIHSSGPSPRGIFLRGDDRNLKFCKMPSAGKPAQGEAALGAEQLKLERDVKAACKFLKQNLHVLKDQKLSGVETAMAFFRFWLYISVVKVSRDHGPARLPGSQGKTVGLATWDPVHSGCR